MGVRPNHLLDGIFHYKPSIMVCPLWKPPDVHLPATRGAALPEALAITARAKKRQLTARGFCNMV